MEKKIQEIMEKALKQLEIAKEKKDVFDVNTNFLGKNGSLSALMKELRNLSAEEKPKMGEILNALRQKIDMAIKAKILFFETLELNKKLASENIDVTIPVKPFEFGTLHPITITQNLLADYFAKQGYYIKSAREIETDYYCFEALNVPKNHPARDAQDTFYVTDDIVLRTHTSATQIHTLEEQKLPIKMFHTGFVYRVDEIDATHSPCFNQFEILVVDENVSMANLKDTVDKFAKFLFGEKTKTRMRPSYFPFTEPSVEVDVTCPQCGGKGCSLCKSTGWIEILGGGMVNPKILENHKIDTKKYSGFAVGAGIERIAMIRYGITDLRELYENDVNLLKQFN